MRNYRKLKATKERENSEAALTETFSENKGDLLMVTSEGTGNYDWVMDSDISFHVFK